MRSSAEVVDVIKKGQARINANRVKNEKRPTIAFQQVVQVPQMPQTADILQFPDIRALHCFVIDPATTPSFCLFANECYSRCQY